MARLTIAGVTAYATECGYVLEKHSKHYGYFLNGFDWVEYSTLGSASIGYGLHTLTSVIKCIRNGHLLSGQSCPLPGNQIEKIRCNGCDGTGMIEGYPDYCLDCCGTGTKSLPVESQYVTGTVYRGGLESHNSFNEALDCLNNYVQAELYDSTDSVVIWEKLEGGELHGICTKCWADFDELDTYIDDQAVQVEECGYCQSTFLMDCGEDDCIQCADCGEKQERYEEAADKPTKENPWTVEEASQHAYTFSYSGVGNFLTIKGYNADGMVVVNDGYDDLVFSTQQIEVMTYGEIVVAKIESQAQVKCIYPNCPDPCDRDCDNTLKCDCGESFTDAVEFISHDCIPQPITQNTSIYIDEIIPSPVGGYEIITAPPLMQRYEVPLLEKCLGINQVPTLADVIREYNDLPLFVAKLSSTAGVNEVREVVIQLGRFAHAQILSKDGDKDLLLNIQRCVQNLKTVQSDNFLVKVMHEIVCVYRDFRKEKVPAADPVKTTQQRVIIKIQRYLTQFPDRDTDGESIFHKLRYLEGKYRHLAWHKVGLWEAYRPMWLCSVNNDFSSLEFWQSCENFIEHFSPSALSGG